MKTHLNLLPWKLQRRMLVSFRFRQWSRVWAVMLIGELLLLSYQWHFTVQSQKDVKTFERRASSTQLIADKNRGLLKQIEELKTRLSKYGNLASENLAFQLLGTVSKSSDFDIHYVQVQSLVFKHAQVPDLTAAPESTTAPPKVPRMRDVRKLLLSGVAKDNLAIAHFVSSLRDSGAFDTVDLKSSQGGRLADSGTKSYQVECTF